MENSSLAQIFFINALFRLFHNKPKILCIGPDMISAFSPSLKRSGGQWVKSFGRVGSSFVKLSFSKGCFCKLVEIFWVHWLISSACACIYSGGDIFIKIFCKSISFLKNNYNKFTIFLKNLNKKEIERFNKIKDNKTHMTVHFIL